MMGGLQKVVESGIFSFFPSQLFPLKCLGLVVFFKNCLNVERLRVDTAINTEMNHKMISRSCFNLLLYNYFITVLHYNLKLHGH